MNQSLKLNLFSAANRHAFCNEMLHRESNGHHKATRSWEKDSGFAAGANSRSESELDEAILDCAREIFNTVPISRIGKVISEEVQKFKDLAQPIKDMVKARAMELDYSYI